MLVGLNGGADSTRQNRNVGQALEAYAEARTPQLETDQRVAVEMVLEIVAAFFQTDNADLIPGAAQKLSGASGSGSLLTILDESFLLRGITSCVFFFPHYCVVSSGLIEFFSEEVRQLVAWSLAEGIAHPEECERFERIWPRASSSLAEHRRLQDALELCRFRYGLQPGEDLVQGRFRVRKTRGQRVEVEVPDTPSRYRLRLPEEALSFFRKGWEVSLVLEKRALGWIALASSLPVSTAKLGALQARARAVAQRKGPTPI